MLLKLAPILFSLASCAAHMVNQGWDIAVTVGDELKLLNSSGTVLGTAAGSFAQLKALAYDYVHHQFLVSDMDDNKQFDAIFRIQLTKEQSKANVAPIIKDLSDDILGIVVDPLTNILYWTDIDKHSINYVSLKDPSLASNALINFKDETIPRGITIDICRRYIYWTNSNIMNPTIERTSLNGKDREVLVSDGLFMPTGITYDYEDDRIYWADNGEGIYFRIESIKADGSGREKLLEDSQQKPFGIAVDSNYVYWTDGINYELYRKKKHSNEPPERIQKFDDAPKGIVLHDIPFTRKAECKDILTTIENSKASTTEYFKAVDAKNLSKECFDHGEFVNGSCQCHQGYSGLNCEISLCYNFCVYGECHFSPLAHPECHCPTGFVGTRCERNVCDGYCLNDGRCSISINSSITPVCHCLDGFIGERCEESSEFFEICRVFCSKRQSGTLIDEKDGIACRCEHDTFRIIEDSENLTVGESKSSSQQSNAWDYAEEPAIIVLSVCMLIMFMLVIILASFVCKLRRRPRIKKRIIVNKNVTPLTYRPQPPMEQCEITIENCCNMNVCETPCFDPPKLRDFRVKKEEKSDLLSNMENGDDVY